MGFHGAPATLPEASIQRSPNPLTADSIRSATDRGSSCSQCRRTVQPAISSSRSCRRSRSTLPSILATHQSRFRFGIVPCSGQECQKQPSRKTATRAERNCMSGRLRPAPGTDRSTRNRKPREWTARRTDISNGVSRRGVFRIRWRVAASVAGRASTVSPIRSITESCEGSRERRPKEPPRSREASALHRRSISPTLLDSGARHHQRTDTCRGTPGGARLREG